MISRLSDRAFLLAVEDAAAARRFAELVRSRGIAVDAVPGLASVSVLFERAAGAEERAMLEKLFSDMGPAKENGTGPLIEVPVVYGGEGGPDLERLLGESGLSRQDWIERHASATYTADILGFTPGFAYLGGLDARLRTKRLSVPRVRVPAGSVAVSGGFSGIYPLEGPGGWPLVGRTALALVDWKRDEPFLVAPGARVRFIPS